MSDHEQESLAVAAARAGDTRLLGRLLESFRPRLERMVAFRMDPRLAGRLDAGDVLQEAFAEVVQRLPDYPRHPDEGLFLWVRFVAHQRLQQLHRKHLDVAARDVRMEVPLNTLTASGASSFALVGAILAASGNTPSRVAIEDERRSYLQAALEDMKDIDREILMLRHFEHISNAEAARMLELSEAGASLRYLRALGRLRDVLAELELSSEIRHDA